MQSEKTKVCTNCDQKQPGVEGGEVDVIPPAARQAQHESFPLTTSSTAGPASSSVFPTYLRPGTSMSLSIFPRRSAIDSRIDSVTRGIALMPVPDQAMPATAAPEYDDTEMYAGPTFHETHSFSETSDFSNLTSPASNNCRFEFSSAASSTTTTDSLMSMGDSTICSPFRSTRHQHREHVATYQRASSPMQLRTSAAAATANVSGSHVKSPPTRSQIVTPVHSRASIGASSIVPSTQSTPLSEAISDHPSEVSALVPRMSGMQLDRADPEIRSSSEESIVCVDESRASMRPDATESDGAMRRSSSRSRLRSCGSAAASPYARPISTTTPSVLPSEAAQPPPPLVMPASALNGALARGAQPPSHHSAAPIFSLAQHPPSMSEVLEGSPTGVAVANSSSFPTYPSAEDTMESEAQQPSMHFDSEMSDYMRAKPPRQDASRGGIPSNISFPDANRTERDQLITAGAPGGTQYRPNSSAFSHSKAAPVSSFDPSTSYRDLHDPVTEVQVAAANHPSSALLGAPDGTSLDPPAAAAVAEGAHLRHFPTVQVFGAFLTAAADPDPGGNGTPMFGLTHRDGSSLSRNVSNCSQTSFTMAANDAALANTYFPPSNLPYAAAAVATATTESEARAEHQQIVMEAAASMMHPFFIQLHPRMTPIVSSSNSTPNPALPSGIGLLPPPNLSWAVSDSSVINSEDGMERRFRSAPQPHCA
jgi:hypothetical protein